MIWAVYVQKSSWKLELMWALCFPTIHNALPAQAIYQKSCVKAIHLKVDEQTSIQRCYGLSSLYSSAAKVFPLAGHSNTPGARTTGIHHSDHMQKDH